MKLFPPSDFVAAVNDRSEFVSLDELEPLHLTQESCIEKFKKNTIDIVAANLTQGISQSPNPQDNFPDSNNSNQYNLSVKLYFTMTAQVLFSLVLIYDLVVSEFSSRLYQPT